MNKVSGYASSTDLSIGQHKDLRVKNRSTRVLGAGNNDSKNKTYMIYWATTIPGRFKAGRVQETIIRNHRGCTMNTRTLNSSVLQNFI